MFLFNKVPTISVSELADKLKEKPVIIDVRETDEFTSGHIPGARHVPLRKIDAYQGVKDKPIYLVCHSGMRSKQAASILIKGGYQAVNVKGGMMLWQGARKGGKN